MVTRRQLLQTAAGVGLIAAVPPSIGRATGVPLHRVVFDSRHEQSVRFATEATDAELDDIVAFLVRKQPTKE